MEEAENKQIHGLVKLVQAQPPLKTTGLVVGNLTGVVEGVRLGAVEIIILQMMDQNLNLIVLLLQTLIMARMIHLTLLTKRQCKQQKSNS